MNKRINTTMKKHLIALAAIGFVSPAMGAVIRMGDGEAPIGGPDGLGVMPPFESEVDPRFFKPGEDSVVGHTDQGPVRRTKPHIDILPLPILDAPATAPAPTPGLPGIDGHGEAYSLAIGVTGYFVFRIDPLSDSDCAVCAFEGPGALAAVPAPGVGALLGVAVGLAGTRRRRGSV